MLSEYCKCLCSSGRSTSYSAYLHSERQKVVLIVAAVACRCWAVQDSSAGWCVCSVDVCWPTSLAELRGSCKQVVCCCCMQSIAWTVAWTGAADLNSRTMAETVLLLVLKVQHEHYALPAAEELSGTLTPRPLARTNALLAAHHSRTVSKSLSCCAS
jgi:hypothetical protein